MRIREFLKIKYRLIAYNCSLVMIFIGLLFLAPLMVIPFFPGEEVNIRLMAIPAGISVILGMVLNLLFSKFRHDEVSLDSVDAAIIVVFTWIYSSLLGAVPFVLTGEYNFLQALFESVSGWTTTGLSVFNVEGASKVLLFFRSWMQFIGGAGFATMMFAMVASPMSPEIFRAEGHSDDILPQIKQAATVILKIYIVYFVVGSCAYLIAGMNLFDAVNHCMAAISTGGFSTKPNSIHSFNSFPIELVSIVLMIIGQTNFSVHYMFFKGEWKRVADNIEVRTTVFILAISIPLIFILTAIPLYYQTSANTGMTGFLESYQISLRRAIFETTSALTSCGFNSVPGYKPWNSFGIMIMIILMWIGGHTNSTAGGIKQLRVFLSVKTLGWYAGSLLLPKRSVGAKNIRLSDEGANIKDRQLVKILCFLCIYFLLFLFGSLLICAHGYSLSDSMFEYASSLGTVGLSVGITGSNAPAGVLAVQIFGMFMGRLEFFIVYMALARLIIDAGKVSDSDMH